MDGIVHFEIPVEDQGKAKEFYGAAFGWQFSDSPMPDGGVYVSAVTTATDEKTRRPTSPGAINGGIMKKDPKIPSTVVTVGVASIDDTIKKVEEAGGKVVMPKTAMANVGEFAYISDPEGNIVGLWTPAAI